MMRKILAADVWPFSLVCWRARLIIGLLVAQAVVTWYGR